MLRYLVAFLCGAVAGIGLMMADATTRHFAAWDSGWFKWHDLEHPCFGDGGTVWYCLELEVEDGPHR